jgi:hypothetical protein
MASSGGTTGTPVTSAPPINSGGLPLPWTHLSLGRWAKIMGINPAHFCRAYAPNLSPVVFPISNCSNVWPRFSWQNSDQVSHEELAYAIQSAEQDIIGLVGYFPSPDWVEQEVHEMPREFAREYHSDGLDIRGEAKKVQADKRKIINGGKRALTLIGTATVNSGSLAYQDLDGDGVEEVAVINMATSLTMTGEIKLYFTGHDGEREWEVRPIKSKTISGGIVTIRLEAWTLLDPAILSDYPTDLGFRAIDISTAVNYVPSVDVYREYNDDTVTTAEFVWQGAGLSNACSTGFTNEQNGMMMVNNGPNGIVIPVPATYSTTSTQWLTNIWTEGVMSDYVRLYYYSGEYSNEFLKGYTTDPLSDFWAQTIAWCATARLTRPLCGCQSPADLADKLSEDLTLSEGGRGFFTPVQIIANPLGTKRGEVMAWRRISKLVRDRRVSFAVI